MNFVQTCFDEHICDCIECLENVDYSVDQILDFLPEAALNILDAMQSISLYQAITCMQSKDSMHLLSAIDVDAMSSRLGMASDQVVAGLSAVTPILLGNLLKQSEGFTHLKKGNKLSRAEVSDLTVEHSA